MASKAPVGTVCITRIEMLWACESTGLRLLEKL